MVKKSLTQYFVNQMTYQNLIIFLVSNYTLLCSADLPMSFENRVEAVGIATEFQDNCGQVFKMVDEDTDNAKTQVCLGV